MCRTPAFAHEAQSLSFAVQADSLSIMHSPQDFSKAMESCLLALRSSLSLGTFQKTPRASVQSGMIWCTQDAGYLQVAQTRLHVYHW